MARINLRLDDDMMLWLKKYSRVQHRSINEQLVIMIEKEHKGFGEIADKDLPPKPRREAK